MLSFKKIIMLLSVFLFAGCTGISEKQGYLTKAQVIKGNPEANYFEIDGKVYVTGIDWLEEVELTKHEVIGEIEDGMASNLPVGTKIYIPKERGDILIAEDNGIEIRYLLMMGE